MLRKKTNLGRAVTEGVESVADKAEDAMEWAHKIGVKAYEVGEKAGREASKRAKKAVRKMMDMMSGDED